MSRIIGKSLEMTTISVGFIVHGFKILRATQKIIAALFSNSPLRLSLDNPEPQPESIAVTPSDHQTEPRRQPNRLVHT
jgi:hypothetical protein